MPGKYLLPLVAVFGTVVGLGSLPAHATQPGLVEVVNGRGGTPAACPFSVFAQGFQPGQALRFTVHQHPSDGEAVLDGGFGIGANGHGRSPVGGEHTLPNGVYELHLIASPPGKTPPHPDSYGQDGQNGRHGEDRHGGRAERPGQTGNGSQAATGAKFVEDGDREPKWFHERFTRVFELACEPAHQPETPEQSEAPAQTGKQEQPVELPVSPTPRTQPEQPQQPRDAGQAHEPELPRTGVSAVKLLTGGLGLMLIGGFLVATATRRRTP